MVIEKVRQKARKVARQKIKKKMQYKGQEARRNLFLRHGKVNKRVNGNF